MNLLSRRETLIGIAGAFAVVTTGRGPSAAENGVGTETTQYPTLGDGADYESLETQLRVFFGSTRGRYLREYLINDYDPRTSVENEPAYDQFVAVFSSGPAEYDAEISNGTRMVVRYMPHDSMYKAIVFLNPDGINIAATALTFYYSPPDGAKETVAGQPTTFDCEQHLSLVVFYTAESLDPMILGSLKQFFKQYPMPREQLLAPILGQDKVRVTVYGRRIPS
jgi:hypothetical protein